MLSRLISLFDRRRQYVVAEATPTLPLRANTPNFEDHLWLCGTAIPRTYGICEHVLMGAGEKVYTGPKNDNNEHALPVTLIPDLSVDPRFHERPFVSGTPSHKYYAGVPLRSARGINIGVLCVFGPEARHALTDEQVEFMSDLSRTIMGLMEARRVTDTYVRSERMVHGLSNFIQGRDEPGNWWSETDHHIAEARAYEPNGVSYTPDGPEAPRIVVGDDGLVEVSDAASEEIAGMQEAIRPSISPVTNDGVAASCSGSSDTIETTSTTASSVLPADPHQVEVDRIFAKAAHIIRESLDIDGAMFLDASVGSFGGLVNSMSPHNTSLDSDGPTSSSDDSLSGQSQISNQDTPCRVFGSSTSYNHPVPPSSHVVDANAPKTLTEKFLKKLMRRYPNGKIFSFDEAGSWYSEDSSGDDSDPVTQEFGGAEDGFQPINIKKCKSRGSPYARRNEASTIGRLFPAARSIAMVPLWDPYKDRWHAGGFVWSKNSARMITKDADLPYLRAFGMITMAEIRRLDVAVSDKAKTDILGSMSHELRSPLHGVVAAAELLHDTQLDAFQVDVVHTIEISGKTLLDTIDHLLAHSKINTFLRSSRARRRQNKGRRGMTHDSKEETSIENGMMTLVSEIQLDALAEEVIESVFIGHSFQHMVAEQLTRHGAQGPMSPAQERLDTIHSADLSKTRASSNSLPTNLGDVHVIIDIDPSCSWAFSTQPGAIRRIIMNLFGNALKYTSNGHIKITLGQEAAAQGPQKGSANVVVTVADTGKGITEEFLRTKLFVPFSQENRLAPGTGLGLSLVRQIVGSLGGSISVKSRKSAKEVDSRFAFDSKILHDVKVSAVGFTKKPVGPNSTTDGKDIPIESLPLRWFGMQLGGMKSVAGAASSDADVIIYSEAAFSQLDARSIQQHPVPSVVICHNAGNAMKFDSVLKASAPNAVFEFVHQPKFGKAVAAALTRWQQLKIVNAVAAASVSNARNTALSNNTCSTTATLQPNGVPGESNVSSMACRLWNLDLDSEFNLALPERRTPPTNSISVSQATHANESVPIEAPVAAKEAGQAQDAVETVKEIQTEAMSADAIGAAAFSSTDQKHFLIVDDNIINLKRLGREHCTSMNGLEALEAFSADPRRFSCILMDINMPVMDGLESTRRIRQFERLNKLAPTTIIAITGLGSEEARKEAFASGLDLFLTRPVRMGELHNILRQKGLTDVEGRKSPDSEKAAAITT
ncbi:histidine kinase [Verticillium alfalfae VaMs.102]|uniref:Histidine kinase n=1 Tax=Verticillium alfalfae (strain VaMs.102 / ATCC MYA-4576 / FGSC 10136) TaxID=526221 RepID=C9SXI1_VERA1|nr:histidine kinase [Verticillium alfalfae VaMs.102]EEY23371.1 histidine kinase [Verticillium alfalfae VaMs.102]